MALESKAHAITCINMKLDTKEEYNRFVGV